MHFALMLIFVNGVLKCSSVLFAEMVRCLCIYKVEMARGDNGKEGVREVRKGSKVKLAGTNIDWMDRPGSSNYT